jgi:hypothetical protein
MPTYDRPTKELMKEFAATLQPRETFTRQSVIDWFSRHYPRTARRMVYLNVGAMSTNNINERRHHPYLRPGTGHDLFFKINRSTFRLSEKIKGQIKGEYDQKLETHKADLKRTSDVEIEKLRSQLNIAASQQNVRFSHLHEKRAEVIAEVYASLRIFIAAVAEYTSIVEFTGTPPRPEREKAAVDAANGFVKLYGEKKIYIPAATALKLDKIRGDLRTALVQFQIGIDRAGTSGGSTNNWIEISTKVKEIGETALVDLEADFRKLLGDDSEN